MVCHGGDPAEEKDAAGAHTGAPQGSPLDTFVLHSASVWVNEKICGQCHKEWVYAQYRSIMQTEAGKIQGALWGWGPAGAGYAKKYGNYDVDDPDGPAPVFGTQKYKDYTQALMKKYPDNFPTRLEQVPETNVEELREKPYTAIFTYLRTDCQRCHVGVKGRDKRGKRIGVSFQGLMEFPYGSPFTARGEKQIQLHTKVYQFIKDDVHHQLKSREGNPEGGLLCQDCHTTTSMHGNGNITGTLLANVEIECSDCHGTATEYPWELPLGWGDEFDQDLSNSPPRGTIAELLVNQSKFGTAYSGKDGYLLTARGNPFGNVVRDGDKVLVHSAGGLDFEVPTLKSIHLQDKWQNKDAAVAAKITTPGHLQKIECYGCHSAWAPQCYGCHVKVDFSGDKKATDWVAAGSTHFANGHTAESWRGVKPPQAAGVAFGKTSENRSYLRWEDPVLGINGEGRVTPLIPGCQQITTVVAPDGETLIHNKIWRTAPGAEGSGEKGQRGLDMAPAMPHTTARQARTCTSCHAEAKSLGYGTHDGRYMKQYTGGIYVDIVNEKGQLVTRTARFQISPIPDLPMDLDQIITREGEQLQTVGHHWPMSRPLTKQMRDNMERVGVCLSCHKEIPSGRFVYCILNKVSSLTGLTPKTDAEHKKLIGRAMFIAANVEVFGVLIGAIVVLIIIVYFARRRRR